ncbi:MAG: N-acetyltransferase [Bacteroidetes bacterium]|nr:MAG: N-acetyltransferase [Bacteroidota bacterium]
MQQLLLRQESKQDIEEVFELIYSAFGQEDEAKLVNALRNNQTAFIPELSLVAVHHKTIVGHILFTKINIISNNGNVNESLALAPLSVRPMFQKKGIGGQLIKKGLEVAKELGYKSVIVLGHQQYYPKFGFQPAHKWHINAPFKVSANSFMAMELIPDGLKDLSGMVVYPQEFNSLR